MRIAVTIPHGSSWTSPANATPFFSTSRLIVMRRTGPPWSARLDYDLPQPDTLVLSGKVEGQQIVGKFKKLPEKKYELTTRGFHWIQERPYN